MGTLKKPVALVKTKEAALKRQKALLALNINAEIRPFNRYWEVLTSVTDRVVGAMMCDAIKD